jgi:hypothetical protein
VITESLIGTRPSLAQASAYRVAAIEGPRPSMLAVTVQRIVLASVRPTSSMHHHGSVVPTFQSKTEGAVEGSY